MTLKAEILSMLHNYESRIILQEGSENVSHVAFAANKTHKVQIKFSKFLF